MAITIIGYASHDQGLNAFSYTASSFTSYATGLAMSTSDFQAGDVIIGMSARASSAASQPSLPTSFLNLGVNNSGASAGVISDGRFYYKEVNTPSTDTSFTVNGSGSGANGQISMFWVLRGVDTTTPIDVNGGMAVSAAGANTTAGTPPSLTPTAAGAEILSFFWGAEGGTLTAYTAPSDSDGGNAFFTFKGTAGSSYNPQGAISMHSGWTSGAFSPAKVGGGDAANGSWMAASISLKPLASSGSTDNLISSVSFAWTEASSISRIRSMSPSSVSVSFSESSIAGRIRSMAGSSVAIAWGETATLSRLRAFVSSAAATWSESASVSRIRQLASSTATSLFTETSTVSRIRSFASSAVSAAFRETSALSRLRQFVSTAAAAFSESSTLARLRQFVSSTAAVFSETSGFAQLKQLGASAVSATWSATSASVKRLRAFVASASATFAEISTPSRLRGFVSASNAVWLSTGALSRVRPFGPVVASAAWSEVAVLSRLRGLTSSTGATWSAVSSYGPLHPLVETPTARRADGSLDSRDVDGLAASRRADGSLFTRDISGLSASRRAIGNLQPRNAAP